MSSSGDDDSDDSSGGGNGWNSNRGRPRYRRQSRYSVNNRQSRSPPRFRYPEEYSNHWQDDSDGQPFERYDGRSVSDLALSDQDVSATRHSANEMASIQAVDGHRSGFAFDPRLPRVDEHYIDTAHTSPQPDFSRSYSRQGHSFSDPIIEAPQRRETPYPFEELKKLAGTHSLSLPCTIPDQAGRPRLALPPRESQGSFAGLASLLRDNDEDFLGTPIKSIESDIQKRLDLIGDHSGTWPGKVSPAVGGTRRPALPTIVTTHPATEGASLSQAGSPKISSIRWQHPLQVQASPGQMSSPKPISAVNRAEIHHDTMTQSSPMLASSRMSSDAVSQPKSPSLVNTWAEQAVQSQSGLQHDRRYGFGDGFKGPRAMSASEIYRRPHQSQKEVKSARRVSYAMDTEILQSRFPTETDSSNSSNERAKKESWRHSLPLQSVCAPLVISRESTIKHRPGTPPPRKSSRSKSKGKSMSEDFVWSSDAEREWSNVVQRPLGPRMSKDVYRRGSPYPRNSTPLDDGKSRANSHMPTSLSVPGLIGQGQLSPIPSGSTASGSTSGGSDKENAGPGAVVLQQRVSPPTSFIDTPRAELEAKIDEMLLHGESSHSEVV